MRTLYFDIDGTVLVLGTGRPKAALAAGRFEDAVRAAGFESIVCVGTFAGVARQVASVRPDYDGPGVLLRLCGDVFRDEGWFRRLVHFAEDSSNRGGEIALDTDWWYVDDRAGHFLRQAGREDVLRAERGRRVCVPDPEGDGADVLDWLRRVS